MDIEGIKSPSMSQDSPKKDSKKSSKKKMERSEDRDLNSSMYQEVNHAKEIAQLKEKILAQVDELIERQNGIDPVAKMETFEVETASRKVLKDLVDTYVQI